MHLRSVERARPGAARPLGASGAFAVVLAIVVIYGGPTTSAAQTVRIGQADGPPAEIFGRIGKVAVASAGVLAVLDQMSAGVRVYSFDGSLNTEFRRGEGPGEIRRALDLSFDREGRLVVFDQGNGRISRFAAGATGGFDVVEELNAPFVAERVCALGEGFVALTPGADSLFLLIDSNGSVIRKLGERVHATGPLRRALRSETDYRIDQGELLCDERSASFFFVSWNTGEVRRYDQTGALRWTAAIPAFLPNLLTAFDRGCCISYPNENGRTVTAGNPFIDMDSGTLVIQARSWIKGEMATSMEAYEHRFRIEDGTVAGAPVPVTDIGVHLESGVEVRYRNDPFPALEIRSSG